MPEFTYNSTHILECEYYVLEELNFQLIVYHPYRPLIQYALSSSFLVVQVGHLFALMNTLCPHMRAPLITFYPNDNTCLSDILYFINVCGSFCG